MFILCYYLLHFFIVFVREIFVSPSKFHIGGHLMDISGLYSTLQTGNISQTTISFLSLNSSGNSSKTCQKAYS